MEFEVQCVVLVQQVEQIADMPVEFRVGDPGEVDCLQLTVASDQAGPDALAPLADHLDERPIGRATDRRPSPGHGTPGWSLRRDLEHRRGRQLPRGAVAADQRDQPGVHEAVHEPRLDPSGRNADLGEHLLHAGGHAVGEQPLADRGDATRVVRPVERPLSRARRVERRRRRHHATFDGRRTDVNLGTSGNDRVISPSVLASRRVRSRRGTSSALSRGVRSSVSKST